ncbi:hypothetical protein [Myxococcus sp. RHSTA-1-4]|uniref:hypothetical protein n=1 Tax=Myxococcus sp. RHSTA-1-4 TaxID=2874601 RepID=UPI001CBD8FFF|nr:hypothetical protein [Myxococcus sp. RHSTA-1-4]MBZ4415299.1 hypothetical protein [Myxococcus sp. RHSTA-1-4]
MSKPSSNKPYPVTLSHEGEIPGVQVVGFHGEVDAGDTPARRAAILVDAEGWLVRILPFSDAPEREPGEERPARIRLERGPLRVDAEGPLPGVGTRLGPWPARLGYTVVLLGQTELRAAARLAAHAPADESGPTRLIQWLAQGRPAPAPEWTAQLNGLVAWYCPEREAHALWLSILREARLAALQSFGGSPQLLEEAAWWLSRTALSDDDLYLSAACLKHAGSPHAEAMLQAMMETPPAPGELQKRMTEQLLFLDAEARLASRPEEGTGPGASQPLDVELSRTRSRVRQGALIQAR